MLKKTALLLVVLAALVACNREPAPAPMPMATTPPVEANPDSIGGGATASGEIAPAQQAQLAFSLPGVVSILKVQRGDRVAAGDLLASLETSALEANMAQAEAALQIAQAHLARLKAGARPEEIAVAKEVVSAARAGVAQAVASLRSAQAQHAVSGSAVKAARANLQASRAQELKVNSGPREEEISAVQAERRLAEAQLQQAQAAYDRVKAAADIQMRSEALALQQASIAYEAAEAQVQAVLRGAAEEDRQAAAAQVEAAQAQVAQAQEQSMVAQALVDQATAALEAAMAQQAQAEQNLALLRAGRTNEELAAAEAQVAQAEAALEVTRVALARATLRAPFDGTVTRLDINAGETVAPGQVVLTLADLAGLRAETTDLSERDVSRVTPGQPARVYVEALGEELTGRVASIAPQASTIGGDVVYAVLVDLDGQPSGLRWGMSVEVEIDSD